MKEGCRIVDAMNTYNLALSIIKKKGYRIFALGHSNKEAFDFWVVKGKRQFVGGDPLRVLGLISLRENTGDNWQDYIPEEDLYDTVLSRAFPDSVDDYDKLTDTEFDDFIEDYRLFFKEVLYKKFPENPTKQELFDLVNSI